MKTTEVDNLFGIFQETGIYLKLKIVLRQLFPDIQFSPYQRCNWAPDDSDTGTYLYMELPGEPNLAIWTRNLSLHLDATFRKLARDNKFSIYYYFILHKKEGYLQAKEEGFAKEL